MIRYTYTASGQKLSQQLMEDAGESVRRDYAGPFVYVNDTLAWINTPHGRIINMGFASDNHELVKEFHLRDHLGNTRIVLEEEENNTYSDTHIADYYPFGMEIRRGDISHPSPRSGNKLNNRYLYNGKEFQDDFELNWYDYGFRFYDPQLARFHTVDPHAENYYHASPFACVENNPISRIDPDGRDWYEDKDGNLMWRRSRDETYTDDDGNEWNNVGTSAIFYHGNTATYFEQNEDKDGNLSLYSQRFSFDDQGNATEEFDKSSQQIAAKNMQSSQWSRDGLQNYMDNPTLGNGISYLGKEVLSQWTDPENF